MSATHQRVREILPHRFPILMVDRVVSSEDGRAIHAIKNVSRDEPCFRGLDPAATAFYPRTLALESFLQAGGILCYEAWVARGALENSAMLFVGLSGLAWLRDIPVGSQLHHHAQMDTVFDAAAVYHGEIRVEGEIVATIDQVTVAVRPVDELAGAAP